MGQREYRLAHLKEYAQYQRNSRRRSPRHHLVYQARSRAKRLRVAVDITVDDIEWLTHCPVLGVELSYYACRREDGIRQNSATLDRRDNSLGYVKGNVFVLSHRANRLKSDASLPELKALVRYLESA